MRIAAFELYRYSVPLKRPLPVRGASAAEREGLLLRIAGGLGCEGFGDAAPLPGLSAESLDTVVSQARQLSARLTGARIPTNLIPVRNGFEQWLGAFELAPSLRFAVETAVLNLFAEYESVSMAELLAVRPRAQVRLNGLVDACGTEALAAANRLVDAGYRCIKLKAGRRPLEEEIATVQALTSAFDVSVMLRVDANRAWDHCSAVTFACETASSAIEYIEEPLTDPSGLSEFVRATGMPVALDETLLDRASSLPALMRDAAAVVLKPTLLGGIERVMELADQAECQGLHTVISSSFESGVGIAALANMAASTSGDDVPAGLDPYAWLEGDVLEEPLPFKGGRFHLGEVNPRACRVNTARLVRIT